MNCKEKELAAKFLELASDEFSNHGCNDIPKEFFKDWTKEEKLQLIKEYHDWNGDPQEFDPELAPELQALFDFATMSFLAHKLIEEF